MLLNICDDVGMFEYVYSNLLIYLCIFLFFVSFLLFLKRKELMKIRLGRKLLTIFVFLLVILLLLMFFLIFYRNYFAGCSCKVSNYSTIASLYNTDDKLKKIEPNKIIIVGDSRMELIEKEKDNINIPHNYIFIAQSGAGLKWFKEEGLPKLYEVLEHKKKNYKYYVVINMGVNDIQYFPKLDSKINEYLNIYHSLVFEYLNVDFYIMSVNPVVEKKLNIYEPQNRRTTGKVEYFNYRLIHDINKTNLNNYMYCDAYHNIYFRTKDGLHYTNETGQEVIDYISSKCINFK